MKKFAFVALILVSASGLGGCASNGGGAFGESAQRTIEGFPASARVTALNGNTYSMGDLEPDGRQVTLADGTVARGYKKKRGLGDRLLGGLVQVGATGLGAWGGHAAGGGLGGDRTATVGAVTGGAVAGQVTEGLMSSYDIWIRVSDLQSLRASLNSTTLSSSTLSSATVAQLPADNK